jgi:hypothetical protein
MLDICEPSPRLQSPSTATGGLSSNNVALEKSTFTSAFTRLPLMLDLFCVRGISMLPDMGCKDEVPRGCGCWMLDADADAEVAVATG